MPTGYTRKIQNGEVTHLNEFIWNCARNFGALVHMRDDTPDNPIYEDKSSNYHSETFNKSMTKLGSLQAFTDEQAEMAAEAAYQDEYNSYLKIVKEEEEQRKRYESMLAQVREWEPPTSEHVGLKEFMVNQLTMSIEFDCDRDRSEPEKQTVSEYIEGEIKAAQWSIDYHSKKIEEENDRLKGRREWIRELHESVPCPEKLKGF